MGKIEVQTRQSEVDAFVEKSLPNPGSVFKTISLKGFPECDDLTLSPEDQRSLLSRGICLRIQMRQRPGSVEKLKAEINCLKAELDRRGQ